MAEVAEEDPEAAAYAALVEAVTEQVAPEWHWIWRAWHRLDAERQWQPGGMGPGQPANIPWTAVQAWADRHQLSADDSEFLDYGIRAMDGIFAAWWRERVRMKDENAPAFF